MGLPKRLFVNRVVKHSDCFKLLQNSLQFRAYVNVGSNLRINSYAPKNQKDQLIFACLICTTCVPTKVYNTKSYAKTLRNRFKELYKFFIF